jgi:hypothetical protein
LRKVKAPDLIPPIPFISSFQAGSLIYLEWHLPYFCSNGGRREKPESCRKEAIRSGFLPRSESCEVNRV